MTKYFLGVDIGATKSHALIADEEGQALGLGIGGSGNYETVGYPGLIRILNAITDEALRTGGIAKGELAGAGFGIAGYDWPAEREPTRQAIETLGLSAPYKFVNDAVLGLLAGTAQGWGVAVVAGTSCNCRGRDPSGREGRVTGNGPQMGEYGGASEVIAKAVQAVSLAWAQRGPATSLTDAFIRHTGATNVADLLEGLNLQRYRLSPRTAPVIFEVAAKGDEVAQEIIHWAGCELGSLAIGVIRQLGFEQLDFEIILVGSMFKGGSDLTEAMAATVHAIAPGARLVRLVAPPVVGGVVLGMRQVGLEHGRIRHTLIENSNKLLSSA